MRYWLAVLMAFVTGSASAQGLGAPGEVMIFVHKQMANTEFVEPLVCALSKVLRAPVRARTMALTLTDDLLEGPTQFSAGKIVARVMPLTANTEHTSPYRYFFFDREMRGPSGGRYSYIESYHAPRNFGVLSVTHLAPSDADPQRVADVTQLRAYKLMLKSIARMSGLRGEGCVLRQSRGIEELDAKSSEFCPQDRTALVAANVLREKPLGSCSKEVATR